MLSLFYLIVWALLFFPISVSLVSLLYMTLGTALVTILAARGLSYLLLLRFWSFEVTPVVLVSFIRGVYVELNLMG